MQFFFCLARVNAPLALLSKSSGVSSPGNSMGAMPALIVSEASGLPSCTLNFVPAMVPRSFSATSECPCFGPLVKSNGRVRLALRRAGFARLVRSLAAGVVSATLKQ